MKKKVVIQTNYHKLFTGFGKNAKNILTHLYKSGKYDVVELANGKAFDDPELKKSPWRSVGTLPRPDQFISPEDQKSPDFQRRVAYGQYGIDRIIKEERPDVYIGAEDIWAFDGFSSKKWWGNINSMIWTTLDSLPILPTAITGASKTKHFYTWASFASKELNRLGHSNVKTLNGSIDTSKFYKLNSSLRDSIRSQHAISTDDFIIGFVFRNQLRKSVPNLLDGFKLFLNKNPNSNAKLLLHTHWGEGWDINRLLKEKSIDPSLVLTTYFCAACKKYEIKPFSGQGRDCRHCGAQGSQNTTNIMHGVSDAQLNEVYNVMDVYCHPFTSGGMEIPVFEAKLSELITLVTNYSCGEDSCTAESGGLPLEWAEYREPGTQFIKATTSAQSISNQLEKVFKLPIDDKALLGKRSRQFVIDNYSCDVIGSKLEAIIDEMPKINWDFNMEEEERNPSYNPPEIPDNVEWLQDIYKNILKVNVSRSDNGLIGWLNQLTSGGDRETILKFFKETAIKENQSFKKINFEDLLDKDDSGRRIALVISGEAQEVFFANSLLKGISSQYPDHNIYAIISDQFFSLMESNPYVHRCIPYAPQCKDVLMMEGKSNHLGYFDICFTPELSKDSNAAFHNGNARCQFELKDF